MSPLTLPVPELSQAVSLAKQFAVGRAPQPLYTQLLFSGDTIRATDGEKGVVAHVSWSVPKPFTVEAERFALVLDSLRADGVERVKLDVSATTVSLKGGRTQVTFLSMDPAEFPMLTPPKIRQRVPLTPEFWAAVGAVEFCVCPDEQRPEFRGVLWTTERLVAADRSRLARSALVTSQLPGGGPLVLPAYLLSAFRDYRSEPGYVGRDESTGLLWFYLETAAIYGPLLASPFPVEGVEAIFRSGRESFTSRKAEATWCEINLNEALPGLQRMEWFIDNQAPRMEVALEDKLVRCTATHDHSIEEVFAAKVIGAPTTVTVNLLHFRDAVQRCPRFGILPGQPLYFLSVDRTLEHLVVPYV